MKRIISVITVLGLLLPISSITSVYSGGMGAYIPMFTAAASNHTLLLSEGGTLTAWGNNNKGQCGAADSSVVLDPTYIKLPTGNKIVQVVAGAEFSLALDDTGSVWSWGDNTYGQLGRTSPNTHILGEITEFPLRIIQIAAGENHAIALDMEGAVWTWGRNDFYQLGTTAVATFRTTPAIILGLTNIGEISTILNHNLAVRTTDNTIWAWGNNADEQLGNSTATVRQATPVQVLNLPIGTLLDFSAGGDFSNALIKQTRLVNEIIYAEYNPITDDIDYTYDDVPYTFYCVYSWGNNSLGQLGDYNSSGNIPQLSYEWLDDFSDRQIIGQFLNSGKHTASISIIYEYYANDGINFFGDIWGDLTYFDNGDCLGYQHAVSFDEKGIVIDGKNNYGQHMNTPSEDCFTTFKPYITTDLEGNYLTKLSDDFRDGSRYHGTLTLHFLEFSRNNLTGNDIADNYFGFSVSDAEYKNPRECEFWFTYATTTMGNPNPYTDFSTWVKSDAITTNKDIWTHLFRIYMIDIPTFGRLIINSSNRNTISVEDAGETTIQIEIRNSGIYFAPNTPIFLLEPGKDLTIKTDTPLGIYLSMPKGFVVDTNEIDIRETMIEFLAYREKQIDYDRNQYIMVTYLNAGQRSDQNMPAGQTVEDVGIAGIRRLDGVLNDAFLFTDDPEVMTISADPNIYLGKENGKKITVTIDGGTLETGKAHDPANWTITGLDGVAVSAVTLIDYKTIELALSGNSTESDYADDVEIQITCTGDEYADSMDYVNNVRLSLTSDNELTILKPKDIYLDKLDVTGGTLSSAFTPDTFSYVFTSTNSTGFSLIPFVADNECIITLGGDVKAGSTDLSNTTITGSNITIKVANPLSGKEQTYTIKIEGWSFSDGGNNNPYWGNNSGTTYNPGTVGRPTAPAWVNPFSDVSTGDWFYGDVEYAVENSLFNGTSATTFEPNTPMTRAMFATVLWRIYGSPAVNTENPFTDIQDGVWYTEAVKWAVANGIVNGYGEGIFAPDKEISRQEMAAMLMRYIRYIDFDYAVTLEYRFFADENEIADYAKDDIQTLNKLEIINGKGNNIIDPLGLATRAEAAAMLRRFMELKK